MKYKIHFPTEQYGFIEMNFEGGIDEAVETYQGLRERWLDNSRGGLEPKEWRRVLDRYLNEGTMEADDYANMNQKQTDIIQEIKRSKARNK